MGKATSRIGNISRVFTYVALLSGVFVLLYLKKDTALCIPPSTMQQQPSYPLPGEKTGTLEPIKKDSTLEHPSVIENSEPANDVSAIQKDETSKENKGEGTGGDSEKGEKDTCDIFEGRWVYDPISSPPYHVADCPFLSNQVSCQRNGRPDSDYERWRWEPSSCEIPRLNKTDLLERLRGKRVVLIGDSLNRNQFESLACLLYTSISPSDCYVDVKNMDDNIFHAKSYNCSVEFHRAVFLVDVEKIGENHTRVMKLDQIHHGAEIWKGADVLIFNTGHWWDHRGRARAWDAFQYEGEIMVEMAKELAFERAMKTWSTWIDQNVDSSKTKVLFRTISSDHRGKDWCFPHDKPLMDESYRQIFPRSIREIAKSTIESMRTPVKVLNVTKLTEYRIDGHTKVYTTKLGELMTDEMKKQPETYADCVHWCVPGVPDSWNHLLYATLVAEGFGASTKT